MSPLLAFTGLQVQRLTDLSPRVLRYWEETGVFKASYVDERPRRPYRRIYTFRDLVSLRTLALLRKRVPLDELRRLGEYLSAHYEAPWAELRFGVAGRRIVFPDPVTGEWVVARPRGQTVIPIMIEEIARTTAAETATLRDRRPEQIGKLARHRHVAHNSWVIDGTRIPTSAVWHFHEAGYDTNGIIREYPDLTAADVEAALAHERRARGLIAA
jgi:DNA-binding transcriptional MerR regulator